MKGETSVLNSWNIDFHLNTDIVNRYLKWNYLRRAMMSLVQGLHCQSQATLQALVMDNSESKMLNTPDLAKQSKWTLTVLKRTNCLHSWLSGLCVEAEWTGFNGTTLKGLVIKSEWIYYACDFVFNRLSLFMDPN